VTIQENVITGMTIIDAERALDPEKRRAWINASEAYTCIRRQWYMKHQPEAEEPQEWGYARRGHAGERYITEALARTNLPIEHTGDEQLSLQDKATLNSATPDGVINYGDHVIVPEFKTSDPRTNKRNLPQAKHVKQLQIAMELIDKSDEYKGKVRSGILTYMDASNFDDIIEFPIDRDRNILTETHDLRGKKIMRTKKVDRLDREGLTKDGGKECRTCAFRLTCGVTEIDAAPRKRGNKGSKFDAVAIEYLQIKENGKAAEDRLAELKQQILEELAKRKTTKFNVGDIEVSITTSVSKRFDKKGAKAAASDVGLDLEIYEISGAASTTLNVKRVT